MAPLAKHCCHASCASIACSRYNATSSSPSMSNQLRQNSRYPTEFPRENTPPLPHHPSGPHTSALILDFWPPCIRASLLLLFPKCLHCFWFVQLAAACAACCCLCGLLLLFFCFCLHCFASSVVCSCFAAAFWVVVRWKTHPCHFWPSEMSRKILQLIISPLTSQKNQ